MITYTNTIAQQISRVHHCTYETKTKCTVAGSSILACCFSVNNFQNIFPLDCCDGHKAISLCVLARQRPTVENNAQVLPVCIRKTVVINCFEVFIERPSNLPARALTFSSYKHHNIIKILVGITQGSISFVSEAGGVQFSDKFITENCGFLDKLIPGDIVMADQGFTITESI